MANTAPAFQFYARDFLASTSDMTAAEIGVYIRALCVQWDKGAVPADDDARMARQFGVSVDEFVATWPVVLRRFRTTKAGYVNSRLEQERKKQADYRQKQAERGKASGLARKRTRVEPALNQRSSPVRTKHEPALVEPEGNSAYCDLHTPSSIEKIKSVSSEAAIATSEPPVLTFPTNGIGGKTWHLTQSQIDVWVSAFPGLDVMAECRKAWAWCDANAPKRKTPGGMPRFLASWLTKATDRDTRTGPQYRGKETISERAIRAHNEFTTDLRARNATPTPIRAVSPQRPQRQIAAGE